MLVSGAEQNELMFLYITKWSPLVSLPSPKDVLQIESPDKARGLEHLTLCIRNAFGYKKNTLIVA